MNPLTEIIETKGQQALIEIALDYVAALRAERDALRVEVERLREGLMRVHNFPSHPGGHVADRSDDVECPEDWRDGWITAVYLVQEAALSAPIRDSRKTAALSAGEKE